jgi:hypothetical protein
MADQFTPTLEAMTKKMQANMRLEQAVRQPKPN